MTRAVRARAGCLLLVAIAGRAGAQESRVVELLREHRRPMDVGVNKLEGSGATFLLDAAAGASFFLLGESHGNRETPRLTQALLGPLRSRGYSVLAVETGPITADYLADLARRDEGVAPFREVLEEYPFTWPFFNAREEAEMLVYAVAGGYRVWGLDQEFAGSGRFFLARLSQLAPDDEARELAAAWLAEAEAGFERFQEEQDSGATFLMKASDEDFAALAAAFRDAPPTARRIVEELRESAAIYQLFQAGENYDSNYRRIRWMKRHLADQLAALGPARDAVRVVMKLGFVHLGRGYSPLHQLDLGNQAAELAWAEGRDSFHLAVVAPTYVPAQGGASDLAAKSPYLKPLFDLLGKDPWVVIDLRPLRPHFHRAENARGWEDLADLAWRYDAVAVVRAFHQAEELVSP